MCRLLQPILDYEAVGTQEKVHPLMMHFLLPFAVAAQAGVAQPPDVDRLRAAARTAEARFERLTRSMAPQSWGGYDGRTCDEIVGRFCLRFDSTTTPPAPVEADPVLDARGEAVEALRRYFSAAPAERRAAGPLVRLLILDGRPDEASSAAATFAALSPDTLWGHLLLGLAHHAAGLAEEAEREFVRALQLMDESTRRDWTDPRWLLDPREAGRVRRLSSAERSDYERRFWLVSDPLWLTEANERWTEHMARHPESRLMAQVPTVTGMLRWGRDLDELTVRYGTPSSRAQIRGRQPWDPSTFVEYFDTAQRAYTPERWMMDGFPEPPAPGEPPLLYAARARSGYALKTVERVLHLPHQVTRFLADDEVVLRVDAGVARPADVPESAAPLIGLFVYDSAFTRRVHSRRSINWASDTTRFTLFVRAPQGRSIYSVEAYDPVAGFAARARYALDTALPDEGITVSDLLIGEEFEGGHLPSRRDHPALQPFGDLVVRAGATLGVYAEVYRLTAPGRETLRVEFALEPAESPGLLVQFGRWLGRATGLARRQETDPRVAWSADVVEEGTYPIAVNLPLDPRRTGRHVLILRVTDSVSGVTAETRRPLLLRSD
jgi:hypothetical protein